jgi:hypothetical protein
VDCGCSYGTAQTNMSVSNKSATPFVYTKLGDGRDSPGYDIVYKTGYTLAQAQELCNKIPDCAGVSYRPSTSEAFLKYRVGSYNSNSVWTFYEKQAGNTSYTPNNYTQKTGQQNAGNDIRCGMGGDLNKLRMLCDSDESCVGVETNSNGADACLKYNIKPNGWVNNSTINYYVKSPLTQTRKPNIGPTTCPVGETRSLYYIQNNNDKYQTMSAPNNAYEPSSLTLEERTDNGLYRSKDGACGNSNGRRCPPNQSCSANGEYWCEANFYPGFASNAHGECAGWRAARDQWGNCSCRSGMYLDENGDCESRYSYSSGW